MRRTLVSKGVFKSKQGPAGSGRRQNLNSFQGAEVDRAVPEEECAMVEGARTARDGGPYHGKTKSGFTWRQEIREEERRRCRCGSGPVQAWSRLDSSGSR